MNLSHLPCTRIISQYHITQNLLQRSADKLGFSCLHSKQFSLPSTLTYAIIQLKLVFFCTVALTPPSHHNLPELCLTPPQWTQKQPLPSGQDPWVDWNFPLLHVRLSKCTLDGASVILWSSLPKLVTTHWGWKAVGLAWSSDVSLWASNLRLCWNFNAMHF